MEGRQFLGSRPYLDATGNWLPAASLLVSIGLLAALLHYRRLCLAGDEDRRNGAELIENLSEGIYRSSICGRQLSANTALVRLNGYATEEAQLAGVRDIGREWYVDPKRRDEFRAILERDGKVEDFVSDIYRHKTRQRIWISESARIISSGQGRGPDPTVHLEPRSRGPHGR